MSMNSNIIFKMVSKQRNVYYVASSNYVQLYDFKQCILVGFLGHVSVIYNTLSHNIPSPVWHIKTYAHVLLVLIFSSRNKQRKTVLYLYQCLIDKSSFYDSFFCNITYSRSYVSLEFFKTQETLIIELSQV